MLLRWKWLRLTERPRPLARCCSASGAARSSAILVLGYLYFRLAGEAYALVSIGLISFAAVAQFAPAIIGGIYWKGGTRLGALCGLAAGFAGLALHAAAAVVREVGLAADQRSSTEGLFGIELLQPAAALRPRRARRDHALRVLEHARQHRLLRRRVARAPPRRGRAQPGDAVRRRAQADPAARLAASGAAARRCSELSRPARPLPRAASARSEALARLRARRAALSRRDELAADAALVHHVESLLAGAIGAPRRASWWPRSSRRSRSGSTK